MKKSDKLMALISIWGILLVLIGHSGFTDLEIASKLSDIHLWIYSFHMPLFFFVSGYLYSLTNKSFNKINRRKFMWKKFKRLLIPYFVLGTIIFVIKLVFSSLSSVTREFSIKGFIYMFLVPQSADSTLGFLWYVETLFVIFLIVSVIPPTAHVYSDRSRISLKNSAFTICNIILCWGLWFFLPSSSKASFLNLTSVLWYLPFFLFGILFQTNGGENMIFKISRGKAAYFWILLCLVIHISLLFGLRPYIPIKICNILTALSGLSFSILLCQKLLSFRFIHKLILPQSDKVYTLYLLSWFGQYPAQILTINILHLNWFICFCAIFISSTLFPLIVHWIIGKLSKKYNLTFIKLTIGY